MKNWIFTLILTLILTLLAACSPASESSEPPVSNPTDGPAALPSASAPAADSKGDAFVGIWVSDSKGTDGYIEFTEGGAYMLYYQGKLLNEGTYVTSGTDASGLDVTGEYPAQFSILGDKLTMKAAGSTETFTRSQLFSSGEEGTNA